MTETQTPFLNLNGVPTAGPPEGDQMFFRRDSMGVVQASRGDLSFEVEAECIAIHDALAGRIFGSREAYHALSPATPQFVPMAGLNSESTLSKAVFEQFLVHMKDIPYVNQTLYLADCQKLV